jgi:aryl-alcohol dehydrogenase-like predicted oxidoreductase
MRIAGRVTGPVGFGCGPLGVHGFGQVDLVDCRRAARMALDQGVTFFDTSDAYGMGVSEEQLALALTGRMKEAVVATKGGIRLGSDGVFYDSSPEWLAEALDLSLRRLGVDYVDLYQLHYWDGVTPLEEVFGTFARFREAGKIGSFGISNLTVPLTAATEGLATYSFEYSMVARDRAAEIAAMQATFPDAVFIPTGVLAQGLLSGRYDRTATFGENDRRASPKYLNFGAEKRAALAGFLDTLRTRPCPVAEAVAWAHHAWPNALPLVGVKSVAQLTGLIEARDLIEAGRGDWGWVDTALGD